MSEHLKQKKQLPYQVPTEQPSVKGIWGREGYHTGKLNRALKAASLGEEELFEEAKKR